MHAARPVSSVVADETRQQINYRWDVWDQVKSSQVKWSCL